MAVDQPLGYKDRIMTAMAELRQFFEANPLEWMVKLNPSQMSAKAQGVQDGMDRTREDAREAKKEEEGGAEGSAAGLPVDRLTDSINKLVKTLESLPGKIGKGKGEGGSAADGVTPKVPLPRQKKTPEDEEEEAGYVNPYIVRGLMSNPLGTLKSAATSWFTGGSGAGIKAPGGIMDMLKGESGEFKPGKALGGEMFATGPGAASEYISGTGMVGAGIAVALGALVATMKMQMDAANDRVKDARNIMEDRRFGTGMGTDWRGATWGTNEWQSRRDINLTQTRAFLGAAGVGLKNFGGAEGEWNKATLGQLGVNAAINAGISNEQMGSLVGAGVRGGTFTMGGSAKEQDDYKKYLSTIANWTEISAKHGISSADSLRTMAEVSQTAQRGANILTAENRIATLSYQERITRALPPELQQQGGKIAAGLMAGPTSDIQRVQFMNQFMNREGQLTPEAEKLAGDVFGEKQLGNLKEAYGGFAPTIISRRLAESGRGSMESKIKLARQYKAMGLPNAMIADQLGMDKLDFANLLPSLNLPDFAAPVKDITQRDQTEVRARGNEAMEMELSKLGEVQKRLSGLTVESAEALRDFSDALGLWTKSVINAGDKFRMGIGAPSYDRGGGPVGFYNK